MTPQQQKFMELSLETSKNTLTALKMALETLEFYYYMNEEEADAKAITAIKEALAQEALDRKAENARELGLDYEPLEAKDEKANDELCRLHDLLGKANALARIRAAEIESLKASLYGLYELEKQRDELEQRLTKTEAQLGEAMWNYGELKREQLANQQKTSGSPINTSAALEAKDEPVAWMHTKIDGVVVPHRPADLNRHPDRWTALYKDPKPCPTCEALARTVMLDQTSHDATPPQRKPLTDENRNWIVATCPTPRHIIDAVERMHGIKGEA